MIKKTLIALSFVIAGFGSLKAQDSTATSNKAAAVQKIGYANLDYIFASWPAYLSANDEITATAKQYENLLLNEEDQLQNLYKKAALLQQNQNPEFAEQYAIAKKAYEDKQLEFKVLSNDYQLKLKKKQELLLQPLLDSAQKAIEAVAKENGYTYIINRQTQAGNIVLFAADESNDISDLVLAKLGVTAKEEGASAE